MSARTDTKRKERHPWGSLPTHWFLSCLALATAAGATETENLGLQILPAPGTVAVDGEVADWDLSGSVFACGDVENHRDKFAVWFAAMYDATNLYLLARWRDDTPMNNAGSTAGDFGWNGDCIQVRVVADYGKTPDEQINVFNCWQGRDGRAVVERDTPGKTKNSPKGDDVTSLGAKQAFLRDADGLGYAQEIAIPWALITADGNPRRAGDQVVLTIEPNFTAGPTNGRLSIKDIFRPGMSIDRVFTFQNKRIWGIATLQDAGRVAPRSVRLSDRREFAVRLVDGIPVVDWTGLEQSTVRRGFKPIRFTMPADGYVSLQILAREGAIVRHLLTAEPHPAGEREVFWDGLYTGFFRNPGEPVPAGEYTWRAIRHKGVGIRLRGWACNSGRSPWDGPDPGDNWGGDMGPPAAVATDGTRMYLGWSGSEAGKALVVTDLDAAVAWRHKRGGFGGAGLIALDAGIAYVVDGQDNSLFCLDTANGTYVPWADTRNSSVPVSELWPKEATPAPPAPAGLTALRGRLYLSANRAANGFVAVIDATTGRPVTSIPVPAPTTIKAVAADRLYVVSAGRRILLVDPGSGRRRLLIDGLSNATGMDVDADGTVYVGTREPDHQVKVFGPDGTLLRTLGKKGGRPLLGPWQPTGMRDIAGIALDARGRLWVTESTLYPRRISVWDAQTGHLVRELFGPTHYGASGGAIHPDDPDVMVGEGCEWRLHAETAQAACVGVFDTSGQGFLGGNSFARFCTATNSRDYLAVANSQAQNIAIYERLAPGDYALRSTITTDRKAGTTTFWADENSDQQVQETETAQLQYALTPGGYYYWSMHMNTDMTLCGGGRPLAVAGFTRCGAPRYDLATYGEDPALPAGLPSLDNSMVLACGVERTPYYECRETATGRLLWQYPNEFAGVHGSHRAPPPARGMLRGAFGPIGCAKIPTVGYVWAINTNVGEWHLLTQDGYYLARLFEPDALKVKFPEQARPGAVIDGVPSGMGGEDFGESLVQGADGAVYIQAGKTALWNCRLTGLDQIRTLGAGALTVTPADVTQATHWREAALQRLAGARKATVRAATPIFTGDLGADFRDAEILSYRKQADAAGRSALAWDAENLYVAWEITDASPWINGAADPAMLYLCGDTVDLQLGTNPIAPKDRREAVAGDLRLSIGNFQGTPTAILYRKTVADGIKKPRTFSSGVKKGYRMDYVQAMAGAIVKVAVRSGAGYTVEAALPLAELGLRPEDKLTLRADLGVTHGDATGRRTRLRTYWSSRHTGIVDDAVYELMMEPEYWGELTFAK